MTPFPSRNPREVQNFPLSFSVLQPESCDGCGCCCERNGSPVLLYSTRPGNRVPHPFRPTGLPPELIEEIDDQLGGLFRGQEPQDRCLWFDPITRQCRHYEWRPQVCRDYELGGPGCLNSRAPYVQSDSPD